jgi:nucleoside triphosphate diphosphatase
VSPRKNHSTKSKARSAAKHGSRKTKRARSAAENRRAGRLFEDLLALQARLRGPGGCPWDREQTPASLRTFLLEETHEVLDAMEADDPKQFASELGDLLLQIVFHALLASETHQFDIRDVIEAVHSKMVRRHPHVFGDVRASTSAQVLKNWEQLKAAERRSDAASKKSAPQPESLLDGISRSLPALVEANQLTRRAAKIGFGWESIEGVLEKVEEELSELRAELQKSPAAKNGMSANAAIEEEAGDFLFAAANVARFLGLDPEIALLNANRKFRRRFQWMEREAERLGAPLAATDRAQMENLWNQSKAPR